MLLYNINDNLKNSYQGEFVGTDPLFRYTPDGNVQDTWTQFPIIPCYAITMHKSQSLTLNSVLVHCSQEFVNSQTYVAMSRVKASNNLRVINFNHKFLLPQPAELDNLSRTTFLEPDGTYACCRYRPLDNNHFANVERIMQLQEKSNRDAKNLTECEEYFESSETTATCHLMFDAVHSNKTVNSSVYVYHVDISCLVNQC